MEKTPILAYYRQHSLFTDPVTHVDLYADLPRDLPGLAQIVQGVFINPLYLQYYNVQPWEIDNTGFGLRRVEDLLQRIQQRYPIPLTIPRSPRDRIGALCRNFAVLLVSMLRQQGIPARARVGFGGYFAGPRSYDHRITEYWDNEQERWILADPMIDTVLKRVLPIPFDPLDIRPGDPFLLAGEVWQRCRAGKLDPDSFGDSDTDTGMPPIRYALLQDFAYLNNHELLGSDDWGELLMKPEAELTGDDLALLDQIAALTMEIDAQFGTLLALFAETAYGQAVREQVATV